MSESPEMRSQRWVLRQLRRGRGRPATPRRTPRIVSAASLVDGYVEPLGRASNDDRAAPGRPLSRLTLVRS